ncbi:MAG TPA: hypothetical protein VFO86_06565 [Terriglobia bacterium]|nr:hypothetical protein [Terriglobia bacterium]
MKLQSVPPYPAGISANGIPTNFVRNLTPSGQYQIAPVLLPGGPAENDFELLIEGSREECEKFLSAKIEEKFPGLLGQQ